MSVERDHEQACRDAIAAGDDSAWEDLGRVLSAQADRAHEAEAAYRTAIVNGNSSAWRGLLRLLARQPGREDAAERAFREAVAAAEAHAPDAVGALRRDFAGALMDKGVALDAAGRPRDALAAFGDVVARFGSDEDPQIARRVAWAFADKGYALQQLGQPDAAVVEFDAAYRRAVALPDRDEDLLARALLGKCDPLFLLGRLDEVVSVCDLALEHLGESTGEQPGHRVRLARALMVKAQALGDAGDEEAAIAVYDEVLARFGDDPEPEMCRGAAWAMSRRAERLYAAGRDDEALHALDVMLGRFGASEDDEERRAVHEALRTKANVLRFLGRRTEALIVHDSAIALARRIADELDDPVFVEWSACNLLEKADALMGLDRDQEAVAARDAAFALLEPSAPAWLYAQLGLALVYQTVALDGLGEPDRAAQVPSTALALLGGPVEADEAPERPRPSDARLAELLAETLSDDCFERLARATDDRERETYAARAVALYRETVPVVIGLPEADEDVDVPATAAAMALRSIAAAYALVSRDGPVPDSVAHVPVRVAVGVSMMGLDHWAEDHGHPLPPLRADEEQVLDVNRHLPDAAEDAWHVDLEPLARSFVATLRAYDVIAAIRGARHGRDVLRESRMRDHAVQYVEYSFGWLRWLEQHESDASIVGLTMLLVAESWHVAGWTDRPLHDEWFPTRAFVREFLAAGDGLSALTDEGVELPGWMQ